MSRLAPLPVGALALVLAVGAGTARAAADAGPAGSVFLRRGLGLGFGLDQVGGYGQDRHPFVELAGFVDARPWRRLFVAAALGYRQDAGDYNFALASWRGQRAPAVAAQLLVGYDGPGFQLAAGPWLYGSSRARAGFRATVLPFGVVRLRAGDREGWHFSFHLGDGAPFTAEGGAFGARFLVGAPVRAGHRLAGGLYTTLGEKVAGLAFADEIAGAGPGGLGLRLGGLLGTELGHPGRPEATAFAAVVW